MAQVRGTNVPPSGSPGNRRTATKGRPPEPPLPARVQEALGELVGVAQEGLLALSVGVGLGVYRHFADRDPLSRIPCPDPASRRALRALVVAGWFWEPTRP